MEILFWFIGWALAIGGAVLLVIAGQAVIRRRVERHRTEAVIFLGIALVILAAGFWMIWIAQHSRAAPGGF